MNKDREKQKIQEYVRNELNYISKKYKVTIVRFDPIISFHIKTLGRILSVDIWMYPNAFKNNIMMYIKDTGGFMSMVDKNYKYKSSDFESFKKSFNRNFLKKYNL